MKKTARKDIRRMIGATKGRYFALMSIVTIGVAFFVGVSSSATVMGASVDAYNDEYHLKDITIYSNYGFDEEDQKAVENIAGVETAELTKFVDVNAASDTTNLITRVHAYKNDASINQFKLVEGRLPENKNECVVERGNGLKESYDIGSTITFSRPEDDLSDYLNVTQCKIVGLIDTPLYLDVVKENSTLNNQTINTYVYLPENAFVTDYYTEMNIIVTDAAAYNSFTDDYETFIKEEKTKIEAVAETQQNHRHDIVAGDAEKKYEDGVADYQNGLEEYNTKIADAQQKITDSEKEIADGEKALAEASQKLKTAQSELDQAKIDGQAKLDAAKAQLDASAKELAQKKTDFETQKKDLNEKSAAIDTAITQLGQAKDGIQQLQDLKMVLAQYDAALAIATPYQTALGDSTSFQTMLDTILNDPNIPLDQKKSMITLLQSEKTALEYSFSTTSASVTITTIGDFMNYLQASKTQQSTLQAGYDQKISDAYTKLNDSLQLSGTGKELKSPEDIDAYVKQLQVQKQQIADGIASGEDQLAKGQAQIDQGYKDEAAGQSELDTKIAAGQKEIDDGWAQIKTKTTQLNEGKTKITQAKADLQTAVNDGTQKLQDAKSKLDKAKQDISELASGKWTVLARTEHYASVAYKNTIKQMRSIAAIFPVFFFMVAALVCLTTMTRMVDEQRGQIGIMRALGYSQRQCTQKYLIYAVSATLIGGLIGNVVGMLIFPGVIYHAWAMLYVLPPMVVALPWLLFIGTDLAFVGVMVLTTWYACHEDMKEVSAELMRPKSPKLGRSTFIEKIPILWSHVTFTWKVTIRNLIRYKKRFFMSIFGVAGCTALLITGFGIRDSIETIASRQFEEIYQYDGTVTFDAKLSVSEVNATYQKYAANEYVSNSVLLGAYSGNIIQEGKDDESVYIQVFDDAKDIQKMYELQTRTTQAPLTLPDDGVIISEKLSENLNKKIGDTITVTSKDGVKAEAKISGICEMYVRHYVFMTKKYYQSLYDAKLADNTIALKLSGTTEQKQQIKSELADSTSFKEVEFFDAMIENFNKMIKGLDVIVLVLILSSASLAEVVLGNLTNVNISERLREIATLKVLGFHRKEVENYIYKENNILTLIGALLGIPLGKLLHSYIMHEVEMDYIMYGRTISWFSCILCVAMTLVFGMLVNRLMAKHLRKIEMVESLKSVE